MAFQAHPYRWPVIGWRSDVENVSRDAIYQYYRTHYGPGNAVAVIVGDVAAADALRLARQHFGPIKPIPKPAEVYTTEPPQRGERRVIVRRSGSLPMVLIAWKAPAALDIRTATRSTCSSGVLGEGRTSRLYQALVEKGLATRVDAGSPSLRDPFLFTVSATARRGVTAEQLETALLEEVERVTSSSHHRRGADPRPAARRGRLRLPDEQRDRAGPSARLLGDDRRLALPHDLSRSDARADAGRHPGGGEDDVQRRHADRRALRAVRRRRPGRAAPARGVGPCRAAEARRPTHPPAPRAGRAGAEPPGDAVLARQRHLRHRAGEPRDPDLRAPGERSGGLARRTRATSPGWRASPPPC